MEKFSEDFVFTKFIETKKIPDTTLVSRSQTAFFRFLFVVAPPQIKSGLATRASTTQP